MTSLGQAAEDGRSTAGHGPAVGRLVRQAMVVGLAAVGGICTALLATIDRLDGVVLTRFGALAFLITGLGVSIVAGGRLARGLTVRRRAEAHSGEGASVTPPWVSHARVEILPKESRRSGPDSRIGPRRAFIVDATASIAAVERAALELQGFTVEVFSSPREALRRSRQERPDVLLLEPRAPGTDGMAFMRAWRRFHRDGVPPVVWCTAVGASPLQLRRAADLGLRAEIMKPFRVNALGSLVVRVCRADERDRRLAKRGIDARSVTGPLTQTVTDEWLNVECELADLHQRPLSMLAVAGSSEADFLLVRAALRATDVVGRGADGLLLVLLPDVDGSGAAVVADRVWEGFRRTESSAAVAAVSRRRGESAAVLVQRAADACETGRPALRV